MSRHYHDLEIEIDQCCCQQKEIRVLESSFDRPRERFQLGQDKREALKSKVDRFQSILLKVDHARERRELAEKIGVELFEILLPGKIKRAWERSYDALRGQDGLRFRLSFGSEYDHDLGALPWELICHPEKRQTLGNNPKTPVARYLDLGERIRPLEVAPPLKILAVIAGPDPKISGRFKYSSIQPEHHRNHLDAIIGRTQYLQIRFLHELAEGKRATLSALREELTRAQTEGSPYHAVHILCHGGFERESNEGMLLLERQDGSEHAVTARELARSLTSEVKLVLLTSCNTGQIPVPRTGTGHPFAGVASALVAAGLPAVVAMQFPVTESAAEAFSKAFYRSIDLNRPIDEAVAEGRLAIDAQGDEGAMEWATPVLFLRAPDGRVLDLRPDLIPPKTVAIYNVLNHGKEAMERADYQVKLFDYFEGRFIRDRKHWNGAILEALRRDLVGRLPAGSPCHLEMAAPLSVAVATGFLLPAKNRRKVTIGQQGETWDFEEEVVRSAPLWLDFDKARNEALEDFPLTEGGDLAVVVESSKPAVDNVKAYLLCKELEPPRISDLVVARFFDHKRYSIHGGAHARLLMDRLIAHLDKVAQALGYPKIHLFFAGPQGLALEFGRGCHELGRIQLYEYDFEKKRHRTYEPSILLESSMVV